MSHERIFPAPLVYIVGENSGSSHTLAELVRAFGIEVRLCSSPAVLSETVNCETPGCVILDNSPATAEILSQIKQRDLLVPAIVLTDKADTALTVKSLLNGAFTVLEKPFRDDELRRYVQEGLQYSRNEIERRQHVALLGSRLRKLAPQDRAVLQLMLEGVKNRSIAKQLDVSLRTVENRRRRVFDVMQADSVAQLTRMVVEYEHNLPPSSDSHDAWLSLPFEKVAC